MYIMYHNLNIIHINEQTNKSITDLIGLKFKDLKLITLEVRLELSTNHESCHLMERFYHQLMNLIMCLNIIFHSTS